MLKSILVGFLILLATGASAQNIKRGFKLLEKADYEKARELFLEAVSDSNPAALLGLTLILADDSSAFFDLIGAWEYACALKSNMEKYTVEELEFIGEYFYNTETRHISRPVKKKIEYAVETVEAKLIKYIREENNLDIVYRVLKEFPDFRYYDNVIHIRNQLEFRKYEKQNTLEAYVGFLQKFPDAAQVDKAIRYRNRLAFESACRINTVDAYKSFMKQYPEAADINGAVKRLHAVAFDEAKKINTIRALDQFMSDYPDALETSEARLMQKQLLYEYAKRIQTLQAYNEFIRKYPEGQQYIDIFNLKSLDNGMRFLTAHPVSSNNIQWARSYEEEENEELTACMTVDSLNACIVGGTVFRTDTGSTDAWIIKLDPNGKMIWNKYIGEAFNDEVNLLAVNNHNEILGAGYTWTGADSASRQSWLFKIGPDGRKLWSKMLGKMHIRTMTVSRDGTIFLGGYLINDSLQSMYSVVALNENGKRLWGRTYTGRGEIVRVNECPDRNILITGTRWAATVNPRGYMLRETAFGAADSIVEAAVLSNGEICYLGMRDTNRLVLVKASADHKRIFEKELAIPEIQPRILSIATGAANRLIALITFEEHQSINWISTSDGLVTGSSRLPAAMRFTSVNTDRNNNLLIEACNAEIILIKNSGLTF